MADMYVEILDQIPGTQWQAGEIVVVPDNIGRAFISTPFAKESDALRFTQAQQQADNQKFKKEIFDGLAKTIKESRGAPSGPPGRGNYGALDIGSDIRGSESSADRGKASFGDICRCMFIEQAHGAPEAQARWARERLKSHYGFVRNEYRYNERDGEVYEVMRTADGAETISRVDMVSRVGTDSLSGGATYGYLVKPEFYGDVFKFAIEDSVIEPFAQQIPMGSGIEMFWPAFDQYQTPVAGQSAAYAGVQLFRKGESAQRTYSDGKMSQIEFKITDLTGFTQLSRDLIVDSYIPADAVIQQLFGMAFAWKKDYEFLQGSGVGGPQGIFGSIPLLTQTRFTAGVITYEDITGMESQLAPVAWKGAYWLTNVSCIPQLKAIKNNAGTYVYQPNALISQAMTPSIMAPGTSYNGNFFKAQGILDGLPLFFTEKVPALGTQGDLNLIHGKSYGIATREGLEMGLSEHFAFDTDLISFRFKLRNDAKPLWRRYYQQADGSNTKVSPFIQLK